MQADLGSDMRAFSQYVFNHLGMPLGWRRILERAGRSACRIALYINGVFNRDAQAASAAHIERFNYDVHHSNSIAVVFSAGGSCAAVDQPPDGR